MVNALVTSALPAALLHSLEDLKVKLFVREPKDLANENEFCQAIKNIDIHIFNSYEKITKTVLDCANVLKLIIFIGTDYGSYIDMQTAKLKNIAVCNTPGANAASVAEFTVGLILDAQRRITLASHSTKEDYGTHSTAYGKTLGLIGFGNIASRVAEICAQGLHMKIQYWTRSGENLSAKEQGVNYMPLDDVLSSSDILSLHVPSSAGCLLNGEKMPKLKPGQTLINTARANLCDPNALFTALSQDPKMYAAFDGFYDEGNTSDPIVKKLRRFIPKQLLVTPHVAWKTFEADFDSYQMALDSVQDFLQNKMPRNMV